MKWVAAVLLTLALAAPATAQTFAVRGFGDVGNTTFTAAQSFAAVLGSRNGTVFGGGIEAAARNVFVSVRASRFKKSGTRVFVFNGERFDLGIPDDVTITPVEVSGGYQFARPGATVIPYAGGGVGWHRYQETSQFADGSDDVDQTFRGYQVLGGAQFRVSRILGIGGEVEWATVPNAIGQNPSSVAKAYNETNLGGTTVRVKVLVGSW